MKKSDIDALIAGLTPVIEARLNDAIAIKLREIGVQAPTAPATGAFSKRPEGYQPGVASLSSNSFDGPSADFRAPIPQADLAGHPCNKDIPLLVPETDNVDVAHVNMLASFVNAVNAKLDALIEATGHGTSAALADHV